MRRPDRYAFRGPPKPPRISDDEALRRTIAAVRTFSALPSGGLQGVKSNWPKEFELHGEAIKLLVFQGKLDDKKFKRLRAQDFDDINLTKAEDDEEDDRGRGPTRREISDALIAIDWFSKIPLLDWNVREFEKEIERYRSGKDRRAWVDDQRFLNWYAAGFSLKVIGERLGINEHEAENRLKDIGRALSDIANGRAKLADIVERQRTRKLHQARSRDLARRAGI